MTILLCKASSPTSNVSLAVHLVVYLASPCVPIYTVALLSSRRACPWLLLFDYSNKDYWLNRWSILSSISIKACSSFFCTTFLVELISFISVFSWPGVVRILSSEVSISDMCYESKDNSSRLLLLELVSLACILF